MSKRERQNKYLRKSPDTNYQIEIQDANGAKVMRTIYNTLASAKAQKMSYIKKGVIARVVFAKKPKK